MSDVRDQLLQGLADNAETIRQVVESFCPSVFLPYQFEKVSTTWFYKKCYRTLV